MSIVEFFVEMRSQLLFQKIHLCSWGLIRKEFSRFNVFSVLIVWQNLLSLRIRNFDFDEEIYFTCIKLF
ncbi:hypothetical protein Q787_04330 [Ornithobacterium rhinotracheale H06-030791]|nr:hypothetical protein Q785_04460 [Ornithobacterium rhinotracheale ORT-UMN 88]KGB67357.1 hypothetical protein Q787_04330 [Ornithobacterium rhinotracheale H06-030791]